MRSLSLRDGTPPAYECFDRGRGYVGHIDLGGVPRATAKVKRRDDIWIATITYPRLPGVVVRYQVARRGTGYCVSDLLGDSAGPPSPSK
jgi:hypothetical protein